MTRIDDIEQDKINVYGGGFELTAQTGDDNVNNTDDIVYGIDKGSPNGDYTALSIRHKNKIFTFVGDEAEVIIDLIEQVKADAYNDGYEKGSIANY